MEQLKWFERKFDFNTDPRLLANIIMRLSFTAMRIRELTYKSNDVRFEEKPNDKWSVKQELFHLIDLDELHIKRLNDLKSKSQHLTVADIANQKTEQEDLSKISLVQLILQFEKQRMDFIEKLKQFSDEELNYKALHPRLQQMMSAADVAYFVAEHDDHHLVHIQERIRQKI